MSRQHPFPEVTVTSIPDVAPGSDCRDAFRAAYENRYTWEPGFGGYQGRCIWEQGDRRVEGRFKIGADLKACLLYTSPSPRDSRKSRMPSSA